MLKMDKLDKLGQMLKMDKMLKTEKMFKMFKVLKIQQNSHKSHNNRLRSRSNKIFSKPRSKSNNSRLLVNSLRRTHRNYQLGKCTTSSRFNKKKQNKSALSTKKLNRKGLSLYSSCKAMSLMIHCLLKSLKTQIILLRDKQTIMRGVRRNRQCFHRYKKSKQQPRPKEKVALRLKKYKQFRVYKLQYQLLRKK